jgi:hypothetical protein
VVQRRHRNSKVEQVSSILTGSSRLPWKRQGWRAGRARKEGDSIIETGHITVLAEDVLEGIVATEGTATVTVTVTGTVTVSRTAGQTTDRCDALATRTL